jgi:hypothetical protein
LVVAVIMMVVLTSLRFAPSLPLKISTIPHAAIRFMPYRGKQHKTLEKSQ